jgi:hypothetical protein
MTSPLKTTTPFGYNPHTGVPPAVVDFTPSKPSATSTTTTTTTTTAGGLVGQVKDAWSKVNRFRDDLNLTNPGTFEGVNREVKSKPFLQEEDGMDNSKESKPVFFFFSFFFFFFFFVKGA